MADSKTLAAASNPKPIKTLLTSLIFQLKIWLLPILLAVVVLLFQVNTFDPAPFPVHEFTNQRAAPITAPETNSRILWKSEFIGSRQLLGPEDIAYEPKSGIIYTGCVDGWIKRVKLGDSVSESVVEDWVNTGGRPLGIAIATSGDELVVADALKGLLKITKNKEIQLLTDEAEGQKFKFTDGVDIAKDGTIYFTDASYKYGFQDYLLDILEARPYGRLLSFDPNTKETKVLLHDLYFPNGVVISPDQNSLIFCETPMKRCRTYWIRGNRKGAVDSFIDNLPGYPDNIHSDGKTKYWIAISSSLSPYLEQANKFRLVRKAMSMVDRYIGLHHIQRNGGILGVDLEGNATLHVYDRAMSLISSGIQIQDHLYIGSLHYAHIIRFNLSYL
ncbi:hypothetical protein BVRB_6g152190 [Beta vulgaris subsp. vulgaris]|nr:hypothetical protein BVRB_6g152190 [Beta vulgaris subsp. vulgaris]